MTEKIWRGNPITVSQICPGSPYVNAGVLSLLGSLLVEVEVKQKGGISQSNKPHWVVHITGLEVEEI